MPLRPIGANADRRRRLTLWLTASLVLIAALLAGSAPLSSAAGAPRPYPGAHARPSITTVTLVTGDVVHVITQPNGKRSVSLERRPDGSYPQAAITDTGTHLYVVPQSAMPLLAAHRLDLDLFDVAGLIKQHYDDAHRATLPVIVSYGQGLQAGAEARTSSFTSAQKTASLTLLGASAFAVDKRRADGFWSSLTSGSDHTGAPTALTDGATRVDLDGQVHTLADPDVEQIHAPEAWAAGYDGTGTEVAVLDTGYDPTHPDLKGQVSDTANFSSESSVVDGNGHGTHVASTIAGTGAAEHHLHGGAAPGAQLMIGKVLDNTGTGEDSWVMAGMEWAVAHHADIVNMSLGGDVGDGTDPISHAIDDLSASSATLFVVAAGNSGSAPQTITEPGAADAALTVGAVDSTDTMADFSSRGPRLGDGAVKPDLVAPGVNIIAARAAGTALGDPVDQYYTSLSGTSMATPHVAAVAAIVKQEHPGWDGEQIKSLLTSTAVPVAGATAFDAGTGRVDAERAIHQSVFAGPSINLGFYPWPQTGLKPTSTPLTYTNTGNAPVTLKLSVGAEDGVSAPPAGVTLSASRLTVPAGGKASVRVLFDPSVPGVGTYSGEVIADPGAGQVPVRTALGFELESEHYNLNVDVTPRAGAQSAAHTIGLVGLDTSVYDQKVVTGAGRQTVTFRVPPGTYSVTGLSFDLAADEAQEGVLALHPDVHVGADTTIALDESRARRFDYATDRPVVEDGEILSVDWSSAVGYTNATLYGMVDRLYATPNTHPVGGTTTAALNWLLTQPDAELQPRSGPVVALRSIAAPGQPSWDVPVPKLSGRLTVVDAGAEGALDTTHAHGAVAVVAGHCDDLTATAKALRVAGAAAMVAYSGDGQSCAGTLAAPGGLPAFQARPFDIPALLASSPQPVDVVTHANPSYMYDLQGWWPDTVPAGATLNGHDSHVAALDERYRSLSPKAGSDSRLTEMLIGWVPGRGAAAYGLARPVDVPGAVTHYVTPNAEWERDVQVTNSAGGVDAEIYAPQMPVTAGTTRTDTWFGGPINSSVSPYLATLGLDAQPNRQGNTMYLGMPEWTDSAGHEASDLYLDEFDGKLFQDGQLVMEADQSPFLWGDFPSAPHQYRLVYATARDNPFWQQSTAGRTAWGFVSHRTSGLTVLPLMVVNYRMPLSGVNVAKAGPYSFGVRFGMPAGVVARPLSKVAVSISWDGGATWTPAGLSNCWVKPQHNGTGKDSGCTAGVTNHAHGSATVRVSATDTAGRTIDQTIVNAYSVR